MNPGNILLYLAFFTGLSSVVLLLYEQIRKKTVAQLKWLIRGFTALLFVDFSLLLYYFFVSDVTIEYVWSFTSKYYPIYYKILGALAGQEGTLLFWALLISIGALWLNEGKDSVSDFVRKAQILVMGLGTYFVAMTLLDSPFKTIYEVYPTIQRDFVPLDGAGLNPLLLDPWMATHPLTMFIGYAGVTVPFAGAMVYLLKSLRGDSKDLHMLWVSKASQWCRVAWLFLTIAIAFGGIWSYKVLGWGGFWAWDPIETASLIPWLMLTGAMHALAEHRRDMRNYGILAPVLVSLSFALVVYATLVTRSGVFESVHAFVAGGAGPYLVVLAFLALAAPLSLGLIKYLRNEGEQTRKSKYLLNKTNIFYLAVLSFIALTFISFFGVTYPAMIKMLTGNKYGVGSSFFNIWSYPFFIFIMLLAGLGLTFKTSRRDEAVREFMVFTGLTIVAAFIRPADGWNIVDYSAIISPQKPLLYTLIGSISALSFLPPSIYIVYAVLKKSGETWKIKEKKYSIGVLGIHLGIVFIILGAVSSSLFTSELSGVLDLEDSATIVPATPAKLHQMAGAWGVHVGEGMSSFGVRLVDYREIPDIKEDQLLGMGVSEVIQNLDSTKEARQVMVYGVVGDVKTFQNVTVFSLTDGDKTLPVLSSFPVDSGDLLVVSGYPHSFNGDMQNRFILAETVVDASDALIKLTKSAFIEVYRGNNLIGRGVTKLEEYKDSDVRRVMIDRGVFRDVYVIFSGIEGDRLSLTIKLVPLMNILWFGVILFVGGIVMIIVSRRNVRGYRA